MDLPDKRDTFLEGYFSKAINWYNAKYLSPTAHRSYAFCAAIFVLLLAVAMSIQIAKLFPIIERKRYIVKLDKMYRSKHLSIASERGQGRYHMRFFAKYLVRNYIKKREHYDFDNINRRIAFVQSTSSTGVLNDYMRLFQTENQNSFIVKYRDQAVRSPYDIKVEVQKDNTAKASFKTVAYGLDGSLIENMQWEAQIAFDIGSNFLDDDQNEKEFNFSVKEYVLMPGKNIMSYETKNS